MIPFLFTCRLF